MLLRKSKKKKKLGLAIITTLMMLSLLLALMSAFLVVNRAGNRLTLNSLEQRQAQDAATTAFHYAWFMLEKERNWGSPGAPLASSAQYPIVSPILQLNQVMDDDTLVGTGVFSPSGNLSSPAGTIELRVRNNLGNHIDSLAGSVPPRSISVEVTANIGGVTKKLDTLLRPRALSHESASAGRNLMLDDVDGLLRIESKDVFTNRIRAGEDIHLPDVGNVRFLKHGIAASVDQLNLGGTDLSGASDSVVKSAGETAGGTFLPNSAAPDVAHFDPADFDLPDDLSSLEPGVWTFGGTMKVEWEEHDVDYDEYNNLGMYTGTGNTRRYQRKESTYDTLVSPSGRVYPSADARVGSTVFSPPSPPASHYPSEGAASSYGFGSPGTEGFVGGGTSAPEQDVHLLAPGVEVNIVTAQVAIHHGRRVNVSGDLVFDGAGTRSPELYFGYDISAGGVATQTALDDGLDAAKENPADYMAAIVADGDINVTGGYIGYGSLVAGGDLTIKASSGLAAAPGLGVLVKGRNIIINPATEPEPGLPGAVVDADYPAFRDAINLESGGDWTAYNEWLTHNEATRDGILTNLGATSSGISASTAWSTFDAQIGGGGSYPGAELTSNSWPAGPLTIEQYVRLKTFYQTKSFGYDNGNGDPSWLDLGSHQSDAKDRVENVLNGIAQWAQSYKTTMEAFLNNPDPGLPDMFTEGVIFADEDIIVNADDNSVKLVGTVVANRGDLRVNDASRLDLVYDRELIDSLYGTGAGPIKLEKVFYTVE